MPSNRKIPFIKFLCNTFQLCSYYAYGKRLSKCDPLSKKLALPALPTNIEFELEASLSVQVVFQLNSDYCTNVSQGACIVSY